MYLAAEFFLLLLFYIAAIDKVIVANRLTYHQCKYSRTRPNLFNVLYVYVHDLTMECKKKPSKLYEQQCSWKI